MSFLNYLVSKPGLNYGGLNNSMIKQTINNRLNNLEVLMLDQKHLTNPEVVLECIDNITKFWSALNDEDKDYVEAAKYALDKKLEWQY